MHPIFLHFGSVRLPTFGVLAALGLMAALGLGSRCAPMAGVTADAVWDASMFAVVAAFAMSRLLLVAANLRSFLQYPVLLLTLPSLTWMGMLLTGVATAVYLRWKGIPELRLLDAWAAPATLLWAFLALGHMAEGSDPGLPSGAAWAVRVGADPDRQAPVALLAAGVAMGLTAMLYARLRRGRTGAPGQTAGMALGMVGVAQFGLTFLRQPYPYAPGAPEFGLDPIQFVALGMAVAGGLLWAMPRRERGEAGMAVAEEAN